MGVKSILSFGFWVSVSLAVNPDCKHDLWRLALAQDLLASVLETNAAALRKAARNPHLDPTELLDQATYYEALTSITKGLYSSELSGIRELYDLPKMKVASPGIPGLPPELVFFLAGPQKKEAGRTVAFNEAGWPAFKGQIFKSLRVEYHRALNTALYHHQRGRVFPEAQVFMPTFPGSGADYSHAGSVLSMMNMLMTAPAEKGFAFLKAHPNYLRIAAETVDPPGSGAGIDLSRVRDAQDSLNWFDTYFSEGQQLAQHHRLLYVPTARSALANVVAQAAQARPGLFDGIVLTSPLHPSTVDEESRALEQRAAKGEYVLNRPALEWVNELCKSSAMNWHSQNYPFGGTPALILFGTDDPEGTPQSRARRLAAFRAMEKLAPKSVKVIEIEGAAHDLFATRNSAVLQATMDKVYRFLHFLKSGAPDIRMAFP